MNPTQLLSRASILLAVMAPWGASAHTPCPDGTWEGKLGAAPVMLRFDNMAQGDSTTGRYYYRHSLEDLLLLPDPTVAGRWREIDTKGVLTGHLTLQCATPGKLNGTWASADGGKRLPLSAKAVEEYATRRLSRLSLETIKVVSEGNFSYSVYGAKSVKDIETVRLHGNSPVITKINAMLHKDFLSEVDWILECGTAGRIQRPDQPYENKFSTHVHAWSKDVLVIVHDSQTYCGEAHANYNTSATIWNLASGEHEQVGNWIDSAAWMLSGEDDESEGPTMMDLILKAYSNSKDCWESISFSATETQLLPGPDGMTFRPTADSYLSKRLCAEAVTLPWQAMRPFLTDLGRQRADHLLHP